MAESWIPPTELRFIYVITAFAQGPNDPEPKWELEITCENVTRDIGDAVLTDFIKTVRTYLQSKGITHVTLTKRARGDIVWEYTESV